MMFTAFRTLLLIGATLYTASGQGRGRDRDNNGRDRDNKGRDRDNEIEDDKCWTCEPTSGCFECLGKTNNGDGTATVEIDFSGCKDADNIGWACCTGSMGPDDAFNLGDCEVPRSGCFGSDNMPSDPEGGSVKCEGVSMMFLLVPSDATAVVMNTHDGRTGNDASPAVGADPICAGREFQGGRCAKKGSGVTSHCLETIDLSSCPMVNGLPMTPTMAPTSSSTTIMSDMPSDMPSPMMMMMDGSDLPSLVPAFDTMTEDETETDEEGN